MIEQNGTPRSATGAVLLALPGIGLGHAYLGRTRRAAFQPAGTVLLAALAAATDAASLPALWWTVAALWSAAGAADAWRLARRTGAGAPWRAPVAVGAVVCCALVAGFLGYRTVGGQAYADGVAALGRGDCAAATERFAAVDGAYELTLSGDVPRARVHQAQCATYTTAAGALDRREYEAAFQGYRDARAAAPDTPLAPFLHEGIVRSLTERAGAERAAGDHAEAVRWYRDLLAEEAGDSAAETAVREDIAATYAEQSEAARLQVLSANAPDAVRGSATPLLAILDEFGDTTTATRVPQAFADLYAATTDGMTNGRVCAAVPLVDAFIGLPAQATAGLLDRARADLTEALLQCGVLQFRADNYAGARTPLERLVAEHPDAPQAAQARAAIIAARVGEATSPGSVALPAPLGGDSPGSTPVTFYNATPYELHVLVAGPTAHEMTLPPCTGCPAEYASREDACSSFDGKPSTTLRLGPGEFDMFGEFPANGSVDPLTDVFVVEPGYAYTNCMYTFPDPPFGTYPYLTPNLPDLLPEIPLPDLVQPIEPPR